MALPANQLLAALSAEERTRIAPHLEPVQLQKGRVLHDYGESPRHAYFPTNGLIAILAMTEDGSMVQVAMLCRDDFVGLPIVLGTPPTTQAVVRLSGDGYRLRADALVQEFRRGSRLHDAILSQADRLIAKTAQAVICHRYHSARQRLCRWILTAHDCTEANTIALTQEAIAEMLAIPRSGVSMAATSLQDRGLIRQRHGRIQLLNRRGLETLACECYRVLRHEAPATQPTATHAASPLRSADVRASAGGVAQVVASVRSESRR